MVNGASKIDEWGLPIISDETMGVSSYCRIELSRSVALASFTAWRMSSALTFVFNSTFRSTIYPSETGTRMAMPSNLPLSSGKTIPTALAAPVVVGIMFSAAALLRRQSE